MNSIQPHISIDSKICRQCRGRCCQGHPGVWVDPERFLLAFNLPVPVSCRDLQDRLYIARLTLREIDGVSIPSPSQTKQGCSFLTPLGCSLPIDKRPCQCLGLTPALDTLLDDQIHCSLPSSVSTLSAIQNWSTFWSKI